MSDYTLPRSTGVRVPVPSRPLLIESGVTPDEFDHVQALLGDPEIAIDGPALWAAWGTRPVAQLS